MDKLWINKAIQILKNKYSFNQILAEDVVSGWEDEDISDITPEEAVEAEASYWREG